MEGISLAPWILGESEEPEPPRRVLGQVAVNLWEPSWLPPSSDWYSGLVPYPVLLPIQLIMLGLPAIRTIQSLYQNYPYKCVKILATGPTSGWSGSGSPQSSDSSHLAKASPR